MADETSRSPRLFGPPRDHYTAAGLRRQAYPWDAYARGYRLAAETLLSGLESPRQLREFVVYPVVFACRHYLELRLKDIITCAHELFEMPKPQFDRHILTHLWDRTRLLAKRASPGENDEFYRPVDRCVRQFHEEDAGSYSFRYPVDTEGRPSLPNLGDFDLAHFATAFVAAADNLDAIADYFHEATLAEREALAFYQE